MPVLRLLCLLADIKVFKTTQLFSQLNNESDLSAHTEVAHAQEADCLQEGKPIQFLLISSQSRQIFQLHGRDLHDVSNIE